MEEVQLVHKIRKGGLVACPNCMNSLSYVINSKDFINADCSCGYKTGNQILKIKNPASGGIFYFI
jgi:hypothetical protein